MEKNRNNPPGPYVRMDWAVLYMRLFAGGIMLFHNIGKMQAYDQIIDGYPSLPPLSPATLFVASTVAEVLAAILIVIGLWVRATAALLAAGIFALLLLLGPSDSETLFIWLGIYPFLIISGSGAYGFDALFSPSEIKK